MRLQVEVTGELPVEATWTLNGQSLEESKFHKARDVVRNFASALIAADDDASRRCDSHSGRSVHAQSMCR